jgi:hypothetical protein
VASEIPYDQNLGRGCLVAQKIDMSTHQQSSGVEEEYDPQQHHIEDTELSKQQQPSHGWRFLNPQDYYLQDDEWRAQQPSGDSEVKLHEPHDGSLQRSVPSETATSEWMSMICYSPQGTPRTVSACSGQSPGPASLGSREEIPQAVIPLLTTKSTTNHFALSTDIIDAPSQVDICEDQNTSDCRTLNTYDEVAKTINPKILFRLPR